MSHGIVIIGSGFAARQLVKNIRRQDAEVPLTLIAADSIDEYNKPDLSHVISQQQSPDAMTRQTAAEFAEQFRLALFPGEWVTSIDPVNKTVSSRDRQWSYDKLVLATGASPILPPVPGKELMLTLNSQDEYRAAERSLNQARRVLILGGGLIGCELAMDFCRAGKEVSVVDNNASLLATLMPPELSSRLQRHLTAMGVDLLAGQSLTALREGDNGIIATLGSGREVGCDAAVAAIGLRPAIGLAQQAGLATGRGIQVNNHLQTSNPDIYALGDCAEVEGRLLPFLQPHQLGALALAKNLCGGDQALVLPPMLVRIKTPELPIQLAGETMRDDLDWQITCQKSGLVARGYDQQQILRAFMVTEEKLPQAFALLKALGTAA